MKARRTASILLAGALLLGAAGCTLIAPNGTLVHYEPSDGTAGHVGDVKLRNVIGLSEDGVDVSLLLTAINSGASTPLDFQFVDASGEKVTVSTEVDAKSSLSIGADDETTVVLRDVKTLVGGLLTVYVRASGADWIELQVPILDGTTEAYSTLLPTPLPSVTPTPTPTATPEPTETPAA